MGESRKEGDRLCVCALLFPSPIWVSYTHNVLSAVLAQMLRFHPDSVLGNTMVIDW